MLPDFNRLKVFYYIYANRSIVGAARNLNITQSAVSQHLKKLEYEIKTSLFTRLHKKLVPTPEGERLFGIIEPFLEELAAGLKTIKQAKVKPSGLLRIGSPPEFGKAYFPWLFATFRKKYPDVSFSLELGGPGVLMPLVAEGRLDLALVDAFLTQSRLYGDPAMYSIEPIIDEEVILAASGKYCETVLKNDFSYGNLIKGEYIFYSSNDVALKGWFKHHHRKNPGNLNMVMTADSIQAVIAGVRHHMGMGVVASYLVYDELRKGKITPITTDKKEIMNKIALVQLQDKVPSLTEKTFQAHFKNAMRQKGVLKKFSKVAGRPPA